MTASEDRVILLTNLGESVDETQNEEEELEIREERGSEPSFIVYVSACVAAVGGLLFGKM